MRTLHLETAAISAPNVSAADPGGFPPAAGGKGGVAGLLWHHCRSVRCSFNSPTPAHFAAIRQDQPGGCVAYHTSIVILSGAKN
ncbi:MAG TPA: hypothetical protein VF276_03080, partial [Chloroflexia bacterium]